jgi:hypothetical protein
VFRRRKPTPIPDVSLSLGACGSDQPTKHPPAKPGGLGCEPLKAAGVGRKRPTQFGSHLKVAIAFRVGTVAGPTVCLRVLDSGCIPAQPARPCPMSIQSILSPRSGARRNYASVPCESGRCGSRACLDVADDLCRRLFRRNRDEHVHMVRSEAPPHNTAFPLLGQAFEHATQVTAQAALHCLSTIFRNENNVVFHSHFELFSV